eukprot:maker-scaffold29_size597861-snap-gene-4.38 protein:Tk04653 transcript:maker-scaffold29_size597861-snap-gene-4.38-mRNA-1 annotation:"protein shuttle craft"
MSEFVPPSAPRPYRGRGYRRGGYRGRGRPRCPPAGGPHQSQDVRFQDFQTPPSLLACNLNVPPPPVPASGQRAAPPNSGQHAGALHSGQRAGALNSGQRAGALNSGQRAGALNSGQRAGALNSGQRAGAARGRKAGPAKRRPGPKVAPEPVDLNLRESLIHQLDRGTLECMICFELIRPKQATWDCQKVAPRGDVRPSTGGCARIFHHFCIRKWSKTAQTEDGGWRCPFCQGVFYAVPKDYRCFCRKVIEPEFDRREIPHSCGEVCSKSLELLSGNTDCPHTCIELSCPCGRTSQSSKCGVKISCDNICSKVLNCGEDTCPLACHEGECPPCEKTIEQVCFCSKSQRSLPCTKETAQARYYVCESSCDKPLSCGKHTCAAQCHPGACEACQLTPKLIRRCPCGQTNLEKIYERDGVDPRKSCLDPIPTCGLICSKLLDCGHNCEATCHLGKCPTCPLVTDVRCRCGFMDKEMACAQLKTRRDDARCDKRCNKKRNCGRHKCNQPCCIDIDHECPLICGKLLGCGTHRCADPCHKNNCFQCPNVSFDELHCYCGQEVIYPPIACGTRPPVCTQACSRNHDCSHPVLHSCHSDPNCPPCVTLTEKWCYGRHEMRKSVACHVEGLSCGRPCHKALPCGRHSCSRPCHQGPCLRPNANCAQPCLEMRELCGHECKAPCHEGACPSTSCKEKIKVTCQCGHLKATKTCSDQTSEFKRMQMSVLMSQLGNSQTSSSADLASLMGKTKGKTLECNEDCDRLERNKRLALALQIENPEQENKLNAPRYSEFMKDMAKKDPGLAQMVYEKLVELVKLAKESKHKSRSYSFDCMNREKRQFVHEYSGHFGVESVGFDVEPKRNVVTTAIRDQVWIPSQSLLDVVAKLRRVRAPVMLTPSSSMGTMTAMEIISLSSSSHQNSPTRGGASNVIDYFSDGDD